MVEIWIVPEWGRRCAGCDEEAGVFGVGDLGGGQEEGVDPNAMDGALAVLSGAGAHQEPGCGNLDERWFEGVGPGLSGGWAERHDCCRVFLTGVKFTSVGFGGW